MKRLAASILMLACSTAALADNHKGLYLGAGVGYFNTKAKSIQEISTAVSEFDSHDTSFKVFGGWRFNRFLAAELAYANFGKPDDEINGIRFEAELDGFEPAVVGTLPLGPIEVFGKVGYLFYDLKLKADGQEISSASGSSEDFTYGGGFGITLFQRLNARVEYEYLDISKTLKNSHAFWLTGSWRF